AEDGIRECHVTGVQTCALPICSSVKGVVIVSRSAACAASQLLRRMVMKRLSPASVTVSPSTVTTGSPGTVNTRGTAASANGRDTDRKSDVQAKRVDTDGDRTRK